MDTRGWEGYKTRHYNKISIKLEAKNAIKPKKREPPWSFLNIIDILPRISGKNNLKKLPWIFNPRNCLLNMNDKVNKYLSNL